MKMLRNIFYYCIASMVAIFAATCGQLLKLPDINVSSGQGFEVKLNFTNITAFPEEVSFVKLENVSGQYHIELFFLQCRKYEKPESGDVHDVRISFFGNISRGHAWFRLDQVNVNDSGIYGVLYKRPRNTDVVTSIFEVNVTKGSDLAPKHNSSNFGRDGPSDMTPLESKTTKPAQTVNTKRKGHNRTLTLTPFSTNMLLCIAGMTNTLIWA